MKCYKVEEFEYDIITKDNYKELLYKYENIDLDEYIIINNIKHYKKSYLEDYTITISVFEDKIKIHDLYDWNYGYYIVKDYEVGYKIYTKEEFKSNFKPII